MRKVFPLLIIIVLLFLLAILVSLYQSKTTIYVDKSWTIQEKNIESIDLYGTEQPIKVLIDNENKFERTVVSVSGNVSKSTLDTIKKAKNRKSKLYIPFSQKGFKLITTSIGKDELIVKIQLGRNATFKFININTWNGKITVKVPKNYDGSYDVQLNQGAKLIECPPTERTMKSVIKIDAYQDTIIERSDRNDSSS